MRKIIEDYYLELINIIKQVDYDNLMSILEAFEVALKEGRRIFVFGNGGSAASANHFACDLGKNGSRGSEKRFKISSLSDNIATITAYANDIDYSCIYKEQLVNLDIQPEDILFVISASGNSPNIVKACEYANLRQTQVIGLSGFGGGQLHQLSNISIVVPSNEYEKVEDIHLSIMHIIVSYFKNKGEKYD